MLLGKCEHKAITFQRCSAGNAGDGGREGGDDQHLPAVQRFAFFWRRAIIRAFVRETACQHLDCTPLAAEQGAQNLLFQWRVKTTDNDFFGLYPLRHALHYFQKYMSGTFAGGDQGEQGFCQQVHIAYADNARCQFRIDTLTAVRR